MASGFDFAVTFPAAPVMNWFCLLCLDLLFPLFVAAAVLAAAS